MISIYSDRVTIQVVMEVGYTPDHCEGLEFRNAIVMFSWSEGSTSICHRVEFPIILNL